MQMKPSLHNPSYSVLGDRALSALFVLLIFLCSFLFFSGSALAASTSAMTPAISLTGLCNDSPHCYAERDWYGNTGGTNTLINPYGALNCQGCAGFIDDETRFSDTKSSQCTSLPLGSCWVEGGISTWPANQAKNCNQGHDSTCGFWADSRPYGGGYHQWPLYNFGADGVDLTPYLFYITITNNNGFSSKGSTWNLTTNIYKSGSWIAGPGAQSANNNMNVNDITIGSELSDSKGSAGDFYFQYNEWMDGNGVFQYQTNTGVNTSTNPPPNGYWEISPCQCQGNTGGSFGTYD